MGEVMVQQHCQCTTELYTLKWLILRHVHLVLAARVGILATPPMVLMGLDLLGRFLASLASVFSTVKCA